MRALFLVGLFAVSGAASAAERGYSVQDFDRMRVEGPYDVTVRTGGATSARAIGPQAGLDRLTVTVSNGVLIIRPDRTSGDGWSAGKAETRAPIPAEIPTATTST